MVFSKEINKKLRINSSDIIFYDHVFGFKNNYNEEFNSYFLYAENSREIKTKLDHYIKNRKPFRICFVYPKALGTKVELTKNYEFNEVKNLGYYKVEEIINISKSYWATQFLNSEQSDEIDKKMFESYISGFYELFKRGWE